MNNTKQILGWKAIIKVIILLLFFVILWGIFHIKLRQNALLNTLELGGEYLFENEVGSTVQPFGGYSRKPPGFLDAMRSIHSISLHSTSATNETVCKLTVIRELKQLMLGSSKCNDLCVQCILEFSNLEFLGVENLGFAQGQIERIKKSNDKLEIASEYYKPY